MRVVRMSAVLAHVAILALWAEVTEPFELGGMGDKDDIGSKTASTARSHRAEAEGQAPALRRTVPVATRRQGEWEQATYRAGAGGRDLGGARRAPPGDFLERSSSKRWRGSCRSGGVALELAAARLVEVDAVQSEKAFEWASSHGLGC
jgi:hypothetical protein